MIDVAIWIVTCSRCFLLSDQEDEASTVTMIGFRRQDAGHATRSRHGLFMPSAETTIVFHHGAGRAALSIVQGADGELSICYRFDQSI